jgi:thiosulfate/3-mercaptopyruvate sulfurtransferase
MTSVLIDGPDVASLGPVHLLDVRTDEAFEAGHPAGAIRIASDSWDRAARDPAIGFGALDWWVTSIGALGLRPQRNVIIVYDDGRMTEAARVWFILQYFGLDARVLNGGIAALPDGVIGQPAEPSEQVLLEPGSGRVRLVGREDLANRLGDETIVDLRTPLEHAGIDLKSNPRGGHIPGAVLLPHTVLLDGDGRLGVHRLLVSVIDAAGIAGDRPIVTHCDAGGRAALGAIALLEAGLTNVGTYYASFSDWSVDRGLPVVAP